MTVRTIGLIVLVVGGFLLFWGPSNSPGSELGLNFFLGLLLVIAGLAIMTYNPISEIQKEVMGAVDQTVDRIQKRVSKPENVGGKMDEGMSVVRKEAGEAVNEIKESTRKHLQRISDELEKIKNTA